MDPRQQNADLLKEKKIPSTGKASPQWIFGGICNIHAGVCCSRCREKKIFAPSGDSPSRGATTEMRQLFSFSFFASSPSGAYHGHPSGLHGLQWGGRSAKSTSGKGIRLQRLDVRWDAGTSRSWGGTRWKDLKGSGVRKINVICHLPSLQPRPPIYLQYTPTTAQRRKL
jgi:hypothetical protein